MVNFSWVSSSSSSASSFSFSPLDGLSSIGVWPLTLPQTSTAPPVEPTPEPTPTDSAPATAEPTATVTVTPEPAPTVTITETAPPSVQDVRLDADQFGAGILGLALLVTVSAAALVRGFRR